MTEPNDHPIAIYLVGYNAESLDRQDDPTADSDGHVISASVMRREDTQTPISPVNVRISHGASPRTISTMLRKMADMVDTEPGLVNAMPGTATTTPAPMRTASANSMCQGRTYCRSAPAINAIR